MTMTMSGKLKGKMMIESTRTRDVLVVLTGRVFGDEPECFICLTQQEANEYMEQKRSLFPDIRCEQATLLFGDSDTIKLF